MTGEYAAIYRRSIEDPEGFWGEAAEALVWHKRWDRVLDTHGFAPAREAWLARAARIGQQVTARLSGATVSGRMITVDESGAIVLDTATGRRHLPAADIFF